jgi:hypothetical protein
MTTTSGMPLGMRPHTLYRFWASGTLLYVGVSAEAYHRMRQHEKLSFWWPDADVVTFEKFPDRASALAAEARAIENEGPEHNLIHTDRLSDKQRAAFGARSEARYERIRQIAGITA